MRPIQKKGARVNSRNKKGTPAQILEIFEKKTRGHYEQCTIPNLKI